MSIARTPAHPVQPERRPEALDEFENHWVAIKDGTIIAASTTSTELAYRLRQLGDKSRGCTMRFVRPASDAYIVGLG